MSISDEQKQELDGLEEKARLAEELLSSPLWRNYLLPWIISEEETTMENLMAHNVVADATSGLDLVALQTQFRYLRVFKEKPSGDIERHFRFQQQMAVDGEAESGKTGLPITD